MLASLLLLFFTHSASAQTCMALCIEGGGSKGAYEAGVLYEMANSPKNISMQYGIITGVSIGAINAGILTNFPIGQEKQMVAQLIADWNSINGTDDIYVEWPGGLITGLLFERGLYNNNPAVELAKKWITGPRMRNITVGSTNLDFGLYQTFNESVGAAIVDAIQASASVPGFFPPKIFEGYAWADGGGIINLDIEAAIVRCLEITGNQRNIIVDSLYDDYVTELKNDTSFKTRGVWERTYEIISHDSSIWYSYNTMLAYPYVNYRYTIIPSEPMTDYLNFSKVIIQNNMNIGFKDGKALFTDERSSLEKIEEHLKRTRTITYASN